MRSLGNFLAILMSVAVLGPFIVLLTYAASMLAAALVAP
jgi:hypothetical protein